MSRLFLSQLVRIMEYSDLSDLLLQFYHHHVYWMSCFTSMIILKDKSTIRVVDINACECSKDQ